MENLTRRLAGFAARLTYPELPPALVDRLKTCLLDAVGCALHGAALPWAAIVNRWVKAQGGPPEATLWRQGFRGPCANVALGLGVMIHGFDYQPAGAVRAQMSLQYIVAVALIEGAALLAQFAEERLGDPRVLDLARRVRIEVDPEIDRLYPERYANRVVITLKDGRRLTARVDHARGSAARPLGLGEVAAKFGSLSGGVLSRERADQVIERIGRLDTMDVIGDLTRLLA